MYPLVILAQHRLLDTERLRPMDLSDLEAYHSYSSDDDLLKYDYPAHQSLEESLGGLCFIISSRHWDDLGSNSNLLVS